MDPRSRDGLLALATLVLLVAVARWTGLAVDPLDPAPAVVGVLGALALEAVLLRHPDRTRALWGRPAVRAVGVLSVLALALVAARTGTGPFVLAALGWGLLAYLALLAAVLAGYPNPVSRLTGRA